MDCENLVLCHTRKELVVVGAARLAHRTGRRNARALDIALALPGRGDFLGGFWESHGPSDSEATHKGQDAARRKKLESLERVSSGISFGTRCRSAPVLVITCSALHHPTTAQTA